MGPALVILGWDSATFDVIDPLAAEGRLPAFSSLMGRGWRAPLHSTWPPMTDSAWTSAFTGLNPGGHGIFGSWYRAPGAYGCRYFSSRDRQARALWELTSTVRCGVWNVPMTFPPTPLEGAMVAGYGAPPGSRFCNPSSVQDELAERWPLEDLIDRAPHSTLESFLDDLLRGLEAQAEALPWFAEATGADCLIAVWPHVDRAQHFFWRFRAPTTPCVGGRPGLRGHGPGYRSAARGVAANRLHGRQRSRRRHPGGGRQPGGVARPRGLRCLRDQTTPLRGRSRVEVPSFGSPIGRRIAPTIARTAVGATLTGQLGGFDWAQTNAFLGFHSDLWLNLRGREPHGVVDEAAAPGLLEELSDKLLDLRDPATGGPVFAAAYRRDEIYQGTASQLAPDLMLDSWSAGYRVAPARGPRPIWWPSCVARRSERGLVRRPQARGHLRRSGPPHRLWELEAARSLRRVSHGSCAARATRARRARRAGDRGGGRARLARPASRPVHRRAGTRPREAPTPTTKPPRSQPI